MKWQFYIGCFLFLLQACTKDDKYSPHLKDASLLPDRGDYLTIDYGTQALAKEIAEAYTGFQNDSVHIKMVIYDNENRIHPLLAFTEKSWIVEMKSLANGALEFGYTDFQTAMMPLKMTTNIRLLLQENATKDTIWLRGIDGSIRTSASMEQPIGTPLPQSDDAELTGYFVRKNKNLHILFDLMLPIAMKAHIAGIK